MKRVLASRVQCGKFSYVQKNVGWVMAVFIIHICTMNKLSRVK